MISSLFVRTRTSFMLAEEILVITNPVAALRNTLENTSGRSPGL